MESGYKYLAFISYKREDEKWAAWLQRKFEPGMLYSQMDFYAYRKCNINLFFTFFTLAFPLNNNSLL